LEWLTSEQISEWEAFNNIEPIGDFRYDYHAAAIQSTIVNIGNCVVPRKRGSPAPKMTAPTDYMPEWYQDEDNRKDIEPKKQSISQMKEILLGWVGNKKGRKKKPIINKKKNK